MKNLVVDNSISVKWFVEEDDFSIAQLILNRYQDGALSFLAPNLIQAEFGNIVWKKLVFRGLSEAEADFAIQEFKTISFELTPISILFDEASRIPVKYKRSFYDSLYLALSVRENCEFVTADEKFYNAVKRDFPKMILPANWQ